MKGMKVKENNTANKIINESHVTFWSFMSGIAKESGENVKP